MDLLDESSGEEEEEQRGNGFSINQNYAERYENWRGKEVIQRLKDKHGDNMEEVLEDDDESSGEEEDSDAEELTEEVEKDFFKTLASLKAKDPKIYDVETKFFSESSSSTAVKPDKPIRDKKITLGDMERKIILEKGGKYDELEDKSLLYDQSQTYAEELQGIKASLKDAADASDDDDDDDLLKPRKKTTEEKVAEESDYKSWLAGQKDTLEDPAMQNDLSGLKSFWSRKDLDSGEKFLKDYLLNKRYKDSDDINHVPTYDELVHDSDENLSEDEANVNKQEDFEHKFNFRFEEPDDEFIKRYPRTIKDSLRQTEDKRKKKRKEVEERKKDEKQQKKEELKLLKSIKKKEILDKLDKLKKITGNDEMALRDEDIEGDFDPAAYDARMAELFESYDTGNAAADEEKPTFSDLEDEEYDEDMDTEDWDNWEGGAGPSGSGVGDHCEDPDFNMDCDYNEGEASLEKEMIANSRGRKNNRRRSKFAAALEDSRAKPVFNPDDKTFEEYVDEYYKLDCEDIIGDLPCRFKYRTVEANDFGLSTDEILVADDKELNAWVSLRKTCQYRSQDDERRDQHVFRNKGKNVELKQKLLPSIFQEEESKPPKKKRKKNNNKSDETTASKKPKLDSKQNQNTSQNKPNNPQNNQNKPKNSQNTQNKPGSLQNGQNSPKHPKNVQNNAQTQQSNSKKAVNPEKTDSAVKKAADMDKGDKTTTKQEGQPKKRRNKKKKAQTGAGPINLSKVAAVSAKVSGKKVNNNKKSDNKKSDKEKPMSEDRLKAFGLNPGQFNRMQRKQKYKNKTNS